MEWALNGEVKNAEIDTNSLHFNDDIFCFVFNIGKLGK